MSLTGVSGLAMILGSPTEIAIIAGLVLLLFGGAKVAGFGKSLGAGIRSFKEEVAAKPDTSPIASQKTPAAEPPVETPEHAEG